MNKSTNTGAASGMYSGTSGLVLPVPKHLLPESYQQKSRLHYYSTLFNSIEINSSFKKLPMARTVARWATEVPDGFQFTFKLPKAITHNQGLEFIAGDVHQFFAVINHVEEKRGCVLIQFPGKLTSSYIGQLEKLLQAVRQSDPQKQWKIAVEFRHASWYQAATSRLLETYSSGMVIHDMGGKEWPVQDIDAAFMYLRFHGPEKGYRGSYDNDFLAQKAREIRSWLQDAKSIYVYFNNTLGDAVQNLETLHSLLADE